MSGVIRCSGPVRDLTRQHTRPEGRADCTSTQGIQLNGDSVDPAHGLVAVAAAQIVSGGRLVVVAKLDGCTVGGLELPRLVRRSSWN